jgi:hypothetical protein
MGVKNLAPYLRFEGSLDIPYLSLHRKTKFIKRMDVVEGVHASHHFAHDEWSPTGGEDL